MEILCFRSTQQFRTDDQIKAELVLEEWMSLVVQPEIDEPLSILLPTVKQYWTVSPTCYRSLQNSSLLPPRFANPSRQEIQWTTVSSAPDVIIKMLWRINFPLESIAIEQSASNKGAEKSSVTNSSLFSLNPRTSFWLFCFSKRSESNRSSCSS